MRQRALRGVLTVALLALTGWGGATRCGAQETTVSEADEQLIRDAFLQHARDNLKRLTPEAVAKIEEPEDICWTWINYLKPALVAYRLTSDRTWLDGFQQALDALLTRLSKAPDGYLGYRGLPLAGFRDKAHPDAQVEVDIAEFETVATICEFAELVRAETALAEAYREPLQRWLDLATQHLAGPKWEQRGLYQDLGERGAVFRMPPECGNNRNDLTNPHNKQSKMCRTYLALYRVTGDDQYFRKAVKLGTFFKRNLQRDGERYLWHYWDPAGPWDYRPDQPTVTKHWVGPEHRGGYHALTVQMVVELYDHGVVFDRADIQGLLNTQMQVCWNGSVTAPVFKKTDGKEPQEGQSFMIAPSLAPFEPRIRELLCGPGAVKERLERRTHGWQGGPGAMGYLVLRHLPAPTAEPGRTRYRDQFAAKPENAAFLKELAYLVP